MGKVVRKTAAEIQRSPARKQELAKLASMPDEAIDLSEIPEWDEEFWKLAVRGVFRFPSS